MISPSKLQNI